MYLRLVQFVIHRFRQVTVLTIVTLWFVAIMLQPARGEPSARVAETATFPPEPVASVTSTFSGTVRKPRWEIGVGGGYFSGFDYPASNDENRRAVAVPFFIYRSPVLRLGDGGVRAVAIERPSLKVDLSIGGSLNANSAGNSVREGMPDLDFLFEIGPQLELRLFDRKLGSGERVRVRLTSEVRAVFSTDFKSISARDFVAEAGIGLNISNVAGTGITLITGVEASFASERLQDYFYEVDTQFVTDSRPFYDASGGYLESSVFMGFAIRPLPAVRLFTGLSYGFFDGASNQRSPLFEVTQQSRFALGIVWTLKTSKQFVDVVELGSND